MSLNGKNKPTILVVDDDAVVLRLVVHILENHGYYVLNASTPVQALQIDKEYSGVIDLLLSDLTMPQMSGTQLAAQVLEHRPDLRIMYMSGFSDDSLLILDHGWEFLKKPFIAGALVKMVNRVLQSAARPTAPDHFDTRE